MDDTIERTRRLFAAEDVEDRPDQNETDFTCRESLAVRGGVEGQESQPGEVTVLI
jgi:hypothetical protein